MTDRFDEMARVSPPKSEIEILREELGLMKSCGIVEIMVRNPNVKSFIAELEARVAKAESALRAQHRAGQEAMRERAAKPTEAMVVRAMNAVWPGWQSDDEKGEQHAFMWRALTAALNTQGDTDGR